MKYVEFLVKMAKKGDAESFILLIEQNKQDMYKVARGFLRNEEDVADAMSETVLTCYEKIGTLKNEAYFKTWMIRVLINHCKDILRKQKRDVLTEDISEFSDYAEKTQKQDGFGELIEPLNERDRSIFTLYYVYGMKIREIAKFMEMKQNTVAARLKRGRETLKNELSSRGA